MHVLNSNAFIGGLFILITILSIFIILAYQKIDTDKNEKTIPTNNIAADDTEVKQTAANGLELVGILECNVKSEDEQQQCYDDFIAKFAEGKEILQVLAELEAGRVQNSDIEIACHPISHSIGRYTFQRYGNIGDAFSACDFTCASGCFHGAMERLFFEEEELTDYTQHLTYEDMEKRIPGICDESKFNNPTYTLIFQCLHGVGHAVLYYLNYDLETAYKTCDLLETDYEKTSCYGGVAMENITAFNKAKRDIKRDDLLYPCNKLEDKYKAQCWYLHTSLLLEYNLTLKEVADVCRKTTPYEAYCYNSLGRDLSNWIKSGLVKEVAQACQEYSVGFENYCITGVAQADIDSSVDGRFAFKFCNGLSGNFIRSCYDTSNTYMKNIFGFTKDQLNEQCDKYSAEQNGVCKASAKEIL